MTSNIVYTRLSRLLFFGFLLCMLLLLDVEQVLGYGKTHGYITLQAKDVWPGDDNHEISAYLKPWLEIDADGLIKLDNLLNHYRPEADNQYSGITILEGTVEEDWGMRSKILPSYIPVIGGEYYKEWVDHFWNPDDNSRWLSDVLAQFPDWNVGPFCLSAFEKAAVWFAGAYSVYQEGDKDL